MSGTVHGPNIQARNISKVEFGAAPVPVHVPHQLLSPPAHFVGRIGEAARLRRYLGDRQDSDGNRLAVITGVGGIGKTSLALSTLNRIRDNFPGGQLFADLGGFSVEGPVSPADVLGWFLRSLGVQPEGVPIDLHERATLFRSLTDGRRLAILLDNAASAAQVRTLLPGPGPSAVVVTSRNLIAGLTVDGARFFELAPLSTEASLELFERFLGSDRTESEPEAVRNLIGLCDGLPLAVCASAARLAPRPHWSIGQLAEELASERRRLSALSVMNDLSVRTIFDVSYRALEADTARFYRYLGLLPMTEFGPEVAAATADVDVTEAYEHLNDLVESNLLQEIAHHRFRFHDLLRLHARERSNDGDAAENRAAIARGVGWYLRAVVAADLLLMPTRWHLGDCYEQRPQSWMRSSAEAIDWLETELPNIRAAVRCAADNGLDEVAWQLCEALWGLFSFRKHYDAWIETHRIGLASAARTADARAHARMHVQLGAAYRSLRRLDEAQDFFERALRIDQAAGHRRGEATALDQLGVVMMRLSRHEEAIGYFERARAISEELDNDRGLALMSLNIGQALGESGRYTEAYPHLEAAGAGFSAIPEPYHEARALTTLADVRIRGGRTADAAEPLERALGLLTDLGATYDLGHVHVRLADLAAATGDSNGLRLHLQRAFEAFTAVGAPQTPEVAGRLEALGFPVPDHAEGGSALP